MCRAGPCELIDFTLRILGRNLVVSLENSQNIRMESLLSGEDWVEEIGR